MWILFTDRVLTEYDYFVSDSPRGKMLPPDSPEMVALEEANLGVTALPISSVINDTSNIIMWNLFSLIRYEKMLIQNENDGNGQNQNDGNAENQNDGNAQNQNDGNAQNQNNGNAQDQNDGNVQNQNNGNAQNQDDDIPVVNVSFFAHSFQFPLNHI